MRILLVSPRGWATDAVCGMRKRIVPASDADLFTLTFDSGEAPVFVESAIRPVHAPSDRPTPYGLSGAHRMMA
jgi:hypothetical protein